MSVKHTPGPDTEAIAEQEINRIRRRQAEEDANREEGPRREPRIVADGVELGEALTRLANREEGPRREPRMVKHGRAGKTGGPTTLIPEYREDPVGPGQPVIVYSYRPHCNGLRADIRDGGRLAKEVIEGRASVATYCTADRDSQRLVVRWRNHFPALVVTLVEGPEPLTRIEVTGPIHCEWADLWQVALGVWLVLRHPAPSWAPDTVGAIDQRWRSIQQIDWSTAPTTGEGRAAA